MSEANQQQQLPKLTEAQKDAARRTGLSEKEFAEATAKLIRSGKINPENIR